MASRRLEKVGELIRQRVSKALIHEVSDPRLGFVTVTRVEVDPDLRHAKVHVSVMGTEQEQRLSWKGLRAARGHLQNLLGETLTTRNTPSIQFVEDASVKKTLRISALLNDLKTPGPPAPGGPSGPAELPPRRKKKDDEDEEEPQPERERYDEDDDEDGPDDDEDDEDDDEDDDE